MRRTIATDDLPDFLLEAWPDVRRASGLTPKQLLVSDLLGEMARMRPGLWTPDRCGRWHWKEFLDPEWSMGRDEFGIPE